MGTLRFPPSECITHQSWRKDHLDLWTFGCKNETHRSAAACPAVRGSERRAASYEKHRTHVTVLTPDASSPQHCSFFSADPQEPPPQDEHTVRHQRIKITQGPSFWFGMNDEASCTGLHPLLWLFFHVSMFKRNPWAHNCQMTPPSSEVKSRKRKVAGLALGS